MGLAQASNPADMCRELFTFHRWRQAQVAGVLQSLDQTSYAQPLNGSFGSLKIILSHLVWAEMVWLGRVDSNTVAAMMQDSDVSEILSVWTKTLDRWETILNQASPADFERSITYFNTKGEHFENTLVEIVFHMVDHATYHVGQMMTAARGFGIDPVPTNIIHYLRATALSN